MNRVPPIRRGEGRAISEWVQHGKGPLRVPLRWLLEFFFGTVELHAARMEGRDGMAIGMESEDRGAWG